jgi:hypothetical protein
MAIDDEQGNSSWNGMVFSSKEALLLNFYFYFPVTIVLLLLLGPPFF